MATTTRHLCRHLARLTQHHPARIRYRSVPRCTLHPPPFRLITTTTRRPADSTQKDEDAIPEPDFDNSELQVPGTPYTAADLTPEDRAHYESLPKPEQAKYLRIQNHFKALLESEAMDSISDDEAEEISNQMAREQPQLEDSIDFREERDLAALKEGFWQEDEDDEFGVTEDGDDDFTEDMITSVAESELEVHREIREYVRIAAWELPGLLEYAQPYERPNMLQTPLRFRYTTYMGEVHPAQKKVVVEFEVKKLSLAADLSPAQSIKLMKLLGTRYNPDKDLVKMSCEKYENAAQNKRYLGDLIQKLIAEAKDATDMFEDIPLDFRHHKPKKVVRFPEEWKHKYRGIAAQHRERKNNIELLAPWKKSAEPLQLEAGKQATKAMSRREPKLVYAIPQRLKIDACVDGKRLLEMHVANKSMKPNVIRQGAR